MKKYFYLVLLIAVVYSGCHSEEEKVDKANFDASNIRALIIDAIKGDEDKNNLLSGLIDLTLPINQNFNRLELDSLTIKNRKYFTVLLEFAYPIYNRFAVYDEHLKCYLIDKSLNGFIDISRLQTLGMNFICLRENFLSKDTIEIQRLTLYKFKDDSIIAEFRNITKVTFPKEDFSQQILKVSEKFILSSVKLSINESNGSEADTFYFDHNQNKYLSMQSKFETFIFDKINNFNPLIKKKSINSQNDVEDLKTELLNSSQQKNLGEELTDYSIELDSTWQVINNFSITHNLKKEIKGTRFINNRWGASISIAKIETADSAESYFSQRLTNTTTGEYRVRYSNAIEQGKNIVLFVEHSCKNKKYIILLEAPKYTYPNKKSFYENILNTFFIEC